MKTCTSLAFLVAAVSTAGCDDAVRAPVTIVVDTDATRAQEAASRLRELQKGVQDDRAQLEKAREELAAARKSLETASTAEQREALAQKVDELEARLQHGAVGDAVTREELDAQLRAQEERLRTFISAELQARPATTATTATTSPTTPTAAAATPTASARALLDQGRARLKQLGVEVADVDGAAGLVAAADAALKKGDERGAAVSAAAFADKAAAVVVDRAFCRRKYDRINALLKDRALPADVAEKVRRLLSDAATKTSAGDAAGANASLNEVLATTR